MAAEMTRAGRREEKRRARGKRRDGDEWEGQIHDVSAVQDNRNDGVINGRWGALHHRMPTNKRNSGMTLGHMGRVQPGDVAIPQIPRKGNLVSDGPGHLFLAP